MISSTCCTSAIALLETGGEGGIRTREAGISRLHTFQACSFNRSDTSPNQQTLLTSCAGRDGSAHPGPPPARCSGPAGGCPNSFPTNLSNPRSGYKPLTHFPGVLLQPLSLIHISEPTRL